MQIPSNPLVLRRRIDFSDTDAAGLIHFTTYFKLMEAAEAELFRILGLSLLWQDESGNYGFPRVDCQCKFRAPLHFDSLVTISLELENLDRRRLHYVCSFFDEADTCCASGSMTTAFTARDKEGSLKSLPVPDFIYLVLQKWKNQAT